VPGLDLLYELARCQPGLAAGELLTDLLELSLQQLDTQRAA
jgi:hypothetical protein